MPTLSAERSVAAAGLAAVLALAGCGGPPEGFSPEAAESLPDAPVQRQAPLSQEAQSAETLEDLPVAELADPQWISEATDSVGISERALLAYAGATLRLRETAPECGIGWNTLAGIGQVESLHGTFGDASLDADGVASPEIIGIPLDGSEGVAEIPDTDGGELDGDDVWDRAVGPMQFIPSTWETYAQDATGDGSPDVHNIDDASLTAAVYLCRSGGEISDDDGFAAGVGAYNRSVEYVNDVARWAEEYAGSF